MRRAELVSLEEPWAAKIYGEKSELSSDETRPPVVWHGIARIPPRRLYAFWVAAFVWTLLWEVFFFDGSLFMFLGLNLSAFVDFWVLPVIPLFAVTWRWLVMRSHGQRSRLAWSIVLIWIALHFNPIDVATYLHNPGVIESYGPGETVSYPFFFAFALFPLFIVWAMGRAIQKVSRANDAEIPIGA